MAQPTKDGLDDSRGHKKRGSRPESLEGGAMEPFGDDWKGDAQRGSIESCGQSDDADGCKGKHKSFPGFEDSVGFNLQLMWVGGFVRQLCLDRRWHLWGSWGKMNPVE